MVVRKGPGNYRFSMKQVWSGGQEVGGPRQPLTHSRLEKMEWFISEYYTQVAITIATISLHVLYISKMLLTCRLFGSNDNLGVFSLVCLPRHRTIHLYTVNNMTTHLNIGQPLVNAAILLPGRSTERSRE